ncbi:sarcosine oxidase subunit gamma [Roseobacter weihaiensis]|uniref:sarcosine oxidase subunit gamma n=1 Tax=Roseobacter weihaiensis TaxID=2763262 RepID=UPI001D09EE31|nr:sarcosine oxidase subunit gamma family protein [Roseobacter sp. H9]
MSEPVAALNGAIFAGGIADVWEVPLQGMITLRGDLANARLTKAVASVLSGKVPQPGRTTITADRGAAWMSPDEILILCAYDEASSTLAALEKALDGFHALVVNVSDARASFRVSGPPAREVMGKLCPVDLSPAAFTSGMFRRTRMAQVPAAFWLCDDDTFQVICFRSHAQYVFDLLSVASQGGSGVGVY